MSNGKTAVAACAVVLALAGCADGTVTAQTTTPSLESPATVSSSAPPAVQDGPLTPTGTQLPFGEAARVMYETKHQGKERTKIAVALVSIEPGLLSDFRDVEMKIDIRSKSIFYVTMNFTNLGPLPLDPTTAIFQVKPYDTNGTKMEWLNLFPSFSPCDQKHADELAVGATHTACAVYVAPKPRAVGKVVFSYNFYMSNPSVLTEITFPPR